MAAALAIPRYAAVGLLECLWHWTAQYAPHGDVGQYDDGTIAGGMGWDGDVEHLLTTLQRCRFLDPHRTHRLVVHNWCKHADQTTQRVVSRSGRNFASGRKVGRIAASQKLAKNYQKIASGGKATALAEHRVKTPDFPPDQQQDSTALEPAANGTNSKGRATRLPADLILTPEGRAYCVAQGCQDPDRVFESFRLHFRATGKAMVDWWATFQGWVRNAHGGPEWKACGCGPLRAVASRPGGKMSVMEAARVVAARMAAKGEA